MLGGTAVIVDGRDVAPDSVIEADVCIVGAGPAGISVADELVRRGRRVAMLERGSVHMGAPVPELEFLSPHFDSPVGALNFQFGGMSPTWNSWLPDGARAARYLELDEIDFTERWWVPHSGWPITYHDLERYYQRARVRCGVPASEFAGTAAVDHGRRPLVSASGDVVSRLDQLAPAAAFSVDEFPALEAAHDAVVLVNTVATELTPVADDRAVTTHGRSASGRRIQVLSRLVVLAGGAIENVRLMLSSRNWHPAGLGNQSDNVGRFFMDHPRVQLGHGDLATSTTPASLTFYETHRAGAGVVIGKLKVSERAMRREQLLNGNMAVLPHHLSGRELSAVRSSKRVLGAARQRQLPDHAGRHLRRIAVGAVPASLKVMAARARSRSDIATSGVERWTGVAARSFRLNYQAEQAPNRWNRVTLTDRVGGDGCRIVRLQWRWSDLDLDSICRVRSLVTAELERAGVGRMTPPDPDELPVGELGGRPQSAHHHLGTTRMSATSRDGVVDRTCRVHGVPGVFVCGGSVFPTGGYANPTLTIVALALRLADELDQQLTR